MKTIHVVVRAVFALWAPVRKREIDLPVGLALLQGFDLSRQSSLRFFTVGFLRHLGFEFCDAFLILRKASRIVGACCCLCSALVTRRALALRVRRALVLRLRVDLLLR